MLLKYSLFLNNKQYEQTHLPPRLSIFLIAFCIKIVDALRKKIRDKGIKSVKTMISRVSAQITVPITCLTFVYSKNVPINGQGLGPGTPIFLKKPYGAYPYLRIKSRIRELTPNPSVTSSYFIYPAVLS